MGRNLVETVMGAVVLVVAAVFLFFAYTTSQVQALSGTEYKLLRVFLAHPNRVLSRDQLIDLMLSRDATPFDRSIDVQVSRLRHRLGEAANEPAIIKTVRSEGYVLAVEVEVEK